MVFYDGIGLRARQTAALRLHDNWIVTFGITQAEWLVASEGELSGQAFEEKDSAPCSFWWVCWRDLMQSGVDFFSFVRVEGIH